MGSTSARLADEIRVEATSPVLICLAAAAATRLIRSLLFGVTAIDPLSFVAAPAALAVTVLLASWLPARRAARVDPAQNLRTL